MSKPVSPTSLIPDRRQTACELTSSVGASAAVFNLGSAAVCRPGSRGVYLRRPDNTFPAKHHGPDLSRSGKCLLIPRYVVRSSCYECSVLAITFWDTEACILFLSQPEASDRRSWWSDSRNHTVTDQFWSFLVWLYAWTLEQICSQTVKVWSWVGVLQWSILISCQHVWTAASWQEDLCDWWRHVEVIDAQPPYKLPGWCSSLLVLYSKNAAAD